MKLTCILFSICTAILLISGCLNKPDKTTGVETTNGIVGLVKDVNGPAAGVIVTLYPTDFNPASDEIPDSLRVVTGSDGKYLFKVSEYGSYNVQAVHPEKQTAALVPGIELQEDNTGITAPDASLLTPGTIIFYPEDINFQIGSRMYIPGTGIFRGADTSNVKAGIFPLQQVPQSSYLSIQYIPPDNNSSINILPGEVSILSEKATTLGGNVDPVLTGTWFSTDPKDWSLDSAYIADTGIKVPGLQVYGGLSFTARNGLMTDWRGVVAVEYILENDTLYTEMIVGIQADGQVDTTTANGFVKISDTVPESYR